jgi:ferredoxin
VHYGGRTLGSLSFLEDLHDYGDRVHLRPEDEVGLLDLRRILTPLDDEHTAVYACGPEPMLRAVEAGMRDKPTSTLHLERFSAKSASADENSPFSVEFAKSGFVATVEADQTILSVATAAGIEVFSSCQEGTCGACVTTILGGRADHRDSILTDEEREAQDELMICVSRATRDCEVLKLDL